jgi:hypothetical protein
MKGIKKIEWWSEEREGMGEYFPDHVVIKSKKRGAAEWDTVKIRKWPFPTVQPDRVIEAFQDFGVKYRVTR